MMLLSTAKCNRLMMYGRLSDIPTCKAGMLLDRYLHGLAGTATPLMWIKPRSQRVRGPCLGHCTIADTTQSTRIFKINIATSIFQTVFQVSPLPSNRHHRSNGDCLEGKRENYQVCSVQYCVQQLCTVQCTHMNRPHSSLDWVLSHWANFTVRRFIFVYVLFVSDCILHACVVL